MKRVILICFTGFLVWRCVVIPIASRHLALQAILLPLDFEARNMILLRANQFEKCNIPILNLIAEQAFANQKPQVAMFATFEAMKCQPAFALHRARYGLAMIHSGYKEGIFGIEEAMRMEPTNPNFKQAYAGAKHTIATTPQLQ